MRYILLISIFHVSLSFNLNKTKMVFDYFKSRKIQNVCLFYCDDNDLAALSSSFGDNIFLSAFDTRSLQNNNNDLLIVCWRQHLVHIGIVLDVNCDNYEMILMAASQSLKLSSTHNWLLIHDEINFYDTNSTKTVTDTICKGKDEIDNGKKTLKDIIYKVNEDNPFDNVDVASILNVIDELNVSVDADVVLGVRKDKSSFQLFDLYNHGKIQGGKLVVEEYGYWSIDDGLKLFWDDYKYNHRRDFQQIKMRMVFVSKNISVFQPEDLESTSYLTDLDLVTRVGSSILIKLASGFNFTYVYKPVDRWIGEYEANSTRVVSNSIHFREQDISPVLRAYSNLANMLDLVQPSLTNLEITFYYRIPNKGIGKIENKFFDTLSTNACICIGLSLALCGVVLWMSAKLEMRSSSYQYAVFSVIAAFCQQAFSDASLDVVPRSSAARKLVVLVTGLSCLLIYNYYTCSVVSWLLSAAPPSFNSLEELADSSLDLILEDAGFSKSWLELPNYHLIEKNAVVEDKLKKKIYAKKPNQPVIVNNDQGIKMVKEGGYAFQCLVDSAKPRLSLLFNKRELCELGSLGSVRPENLYAVVPKRSPYKEFMNWGLLLLKERGHYKYVQNRMEPPDISCDGTIPRALSLGGSVPAFLLLFLGCCLAVLVLIFEFIMDKMISSKKVIVPFVN